MPPAKFKRHKFGKECMMEQPVPLAYYSTFNKGDDGPKFHPRTIGQLINLRTKQFVQNKRNNNMNVSVKEFENYQLEFREALFSIFDGKADINQSELDKEFENFSIAEDIKDMRQRERIMGIDIPHSISAEVEAMTDEELNLAFEAITPQPLTLTQQTAAGNIQIPTFLEATHAGGRGRGSGSAGRGRGGGGRGTSVIAQSLSNIITTEPSGAVSPLLPEAGTSTDLSLTARGERSFLRDIVKRDA
jgi:hypothetical protein